MRNETRSRKEKIPQGTPVIFVLSKTTDMNIVRSFANAFLVEFKGVEFFLVKNIRTKKFTAEFQTRHERLDDANQDLKRVKFDTMETANEYMEQTVINFIDELCCLKYDM
jgi:hypothetical protein